MVSDVEFYCGKYFSLLDNCNNTTDELMILWPSGLVEKKKKGSKEMNRQRWD